MHDHGRIHLLPDHVGSLSSTEVDLLPRPRVEHDPQRGREVHWLLLAVVQQVLAHVFRPVAMHEVDLVGHVGGRLVDGWVICGFLDSAFPRLAGHRLIPVAHIQEFEDLLGFFIQLHSLALELQVFLSVLVLGGFDLSLGYFKVQLLFSEVTRSLDL